jgi:hypothetical protein
LTKIPKEHSGENIVPVTSGAGETGHLPVEVEESSKT